MSANHPINLNSGAEREPHTGIQSTPTGAVVPRADTIIAHHGETLHSIVTRAYGVNTRTNRERINAANATLTGEIRVPR